MRFKNYRNSFNKRNRIYSDEDLLQMQLAAIFDNEEEILAQNRDIGIPTLSELQNSQNTQWVKSFVGTDRLNNGGYWQSILDEENEGLEEEGI